MISTVIDQSLGLEFPIFQGGMAWVADASLAAGVSNAGGLGIIAAMNSNGEQLREEIRKCKTMTDKIFGVNIMLMSPFAEEVSDVVVEEGIKVMHSCSRARMCSRPWAPCPAAASSATPSASTPCSARTPASASPWETTAWSKRACTSPPAPRSPSTTRPRSPPANRSKPSRAPNCPARTTSCSSATPCPAASRRATARPASSSTRNSTRTENGMAESVIRALRKRKLVKITLITVGKVKEKYLRDAIAEYSKRLGRYCKLGIVEVADEKTPEHASDGLERQIKAKEGERIAKHIRDDAFVIALAIEGKQLTSEQLAAKINDLGLHGTSHIQLIIGGSLGLDPAILKRADYLLSFSKMTFPHQLMRVILLEQIYRAYKINAGEPYHK